MGSKKQKISKPLNFVAKHMNSFNKSVTMKDKKKSSKNGEQKHKKVNTDY